MPYLSQRTEKAEEKNFQNFIIVWCEDSGSSQLAYCYVRKGKFPGITHFKSVLTRSHDPTRPDPTRQAKPNRNEARSLSLNCSTSLPGRSCQIPDYLRDALSGGRLENVTKWLTTSTVVLYSQLNACSRAAFDPSQVSLP